MEDEIVTEMMEEVQKITDKTEKPKNRVIFHCDNCQTELFDDDEAWDILKQSIGEYGILLMKLRGVINHLKMIEPDLQSMMKQVRDYERLDILSTLYISINDKRELDDSIEVFKPVVEQALEFLNTYEVQYKKEMAKRKK